MRLLVGLFVPSFVFSCVRYLMCVFVLPDVIRSFIHSVFFFFFHKCRYYQYVVLMYFLGFVNSGPGLWSAKPKDTPKWLVSLVNLTLYSMRTHFDASTTDSFLKNIVEKEEIARNEQFLLFPQCFLLNQITVSLLILSIFLTSYLYLLMNRKTSKLAYEAKDCCCSFDLTSSRLPVAQ